MGEKRGKEPWRKGGREEGRGAGATAGTPLRRLCRLGSKGLLRDVAGCPVPQGGPGPGGARRRGGRAGPRTRWWRRRRRRRTAGRRTGARPTTTRRPAPGPGRRSASPPPRGWPARRRRSVPPWEALWGGRALWFFRGGRGEGPPWGGSALRQPLPAPPRPALPHQGNFRWGVAKTERERETEEEGHPARGPAGGPSMALSLSGSQMIDPNALARREAEVARREVRLRALPPPPARGARSAPLRPAGRHMHPSPRVPRPPPCLRGGTWRVRAPYGASCPADSSRRPPTPTPLARPLPTNSDPFPPTSAARRSTRRRGRGRGGAARGLTGGGPARRNNATSARSSWTSSTRRSSRCPRSWRP